MRSSLVISEDVTGEIVHDINALGDTWGSCRVLADYKLSNCICTDISIAKQLITNKVHQKSTLYIKQEHYQAVGSPVGVKLINSETNNLINIDDIIALNLVRDSEIVLLLGFDFTEDSERDEYYFNVQEIIKSEPETQFVFVEYNNELPTWLMKFDNVTQDTVENVRSLLV